MVKPELVNFQETIVQLRSFLAEPIANDRDRAGIIQAFEFTFEQAWKAIQKVGKNSGVTVGNPKQAFMLGIQSGWIPRAQEAKWLKLIEDRNLTSHTYQKKIAQEILVRVQSDYINMFEQLLVNLDK